jgi:DNA polymerase-1
VEGRLTTGAIDATYYSLRPSEAPPLRRIEANGFLDVVTASTASTPRTWTPRRSSPSGPDESLRASNCSHPRPTRASPTSASATTSPCWTSSQVQAEEGHRQLRGRQDHAPAQKDSDTGLVKAGRLPGKLHGKHSIEAWGYRLGVQKLHADIEDWSVYTPEMGERCESDVDVQDACGTG